MSRCNSEWSFDIIKTLSCCSCNNSFQLRDQNAALSARGPILLTCNHAACETCVNKEEDAFSTLCQRCNRNRSESLPNMKLLTPHIYISGHLSVAKWFRPRRKLELKSISHSAKTLCIECSNVSDVGCKQCQTYFCCKCWENVHSSAKSLKLHEKVSLESFIGTKDNRDECSVHHQQCLEFFCKQCDQILCSHCIVLYHQGHPSQRLIDRNEALVNELKSALETTKSQLTWMQYNLKLVQLEKENCNNNAGAVETKKREVFEYFACLHGALQKQEQETLQTFAAISEKKFNEMTVFEDVLTSQIKELTTLVNQVERALKGQLTTPVPNFPRLLEQLNLVSQMPCHLVKNDNQQSNHLTLEINEKAMDGIKDIVTVKDGGASEYSLLSLAELPEGSSPPELIPQVLVDIENLSIEAPDADDEKSLLSVDLNPSEKSAKKKCPGKKKKNQETFHSGRQRKRQSSSESSCEWLSRPDWQFRFQYAVLKYIPVRVCFIIDPGRFFVHDVREERLLEKLQHKISSYISTARKVDKISKGTHVLAMFKSQWYRALVQDVVDNKVTVDFYDYGNQSVVNFSELRFSHPSLFNGDIPPLALPCALHNIQPVKGEWSEAATNLLNELLGHPANKTMMVTMHQNDDALVVDLAVHINDSFGREVVSVRDLLLYYKYGDVSIEGYEDPPKDMTILPIAYRPRRSPHAKDLIQVYVTHVISPSHFYLQKVDPDTWYWKEMISSMTEMYSNNLKKGILLLPYHGLPCAVKDPITNSWHRGQILSLNGVFKVMLVDIGTIIPLDMKNVRRLHQAFFKCPPQCVRASLAEIAPSSGEWTTAAVKAMRSLVKKKAFNALVVKVRGEELEVVLYEPGTNGTNINLMLVKNGFAELLDTANLILTPGIHPNKTYSGKPHTIRSARYNKKDTIKQPEKKIINLKESNEAIEVKIIKSASPGLVYFALDDYEEQLMNIHHHLKEIFHSSLPDQDIQWRSFQDVAFFSRSSNYWLRGCIQNVSEDECTVLATDLMTEEKVAVSNIRELCEETSQTKLLYKCHLMGIRPAGPTWTSLVIDELEEQFKGSESIHLLKKGDLGEDSLPVEFFIKETIFPGALKPAKIIFRCLNETLVNKGLARKVENYAFGKLELSDDGNKLLVKSPGFESEASTATSCRSPTVPCAIPATTPVNTLVLPPVTRDWLPPNPITKKRILGLITYVDERGVLYFHDKETEGPLISQIQGKLTESYQNTKPNHRDQFWAVGQICAARYHLDGSWNRAKILKVGFGDSRKYLVLFVDYGNIETCQVTELRKGVHCLDVPILCHSCYIADLLPKAGKKFAKEGIGLLHLLTVEKDFIIDVLGSCNEPFPAHLTWLGSKIDIFDVLVTENHALRVKEQLTYELPERDLSGTENLQDMKVEEEGQLKHPPTSPKALPTDVSCNSVTAEEPIDGLFTLSKSESVVADERITKAPSWHGNSLTIPPSVSQISVTAIQVHEDDVLIARLTPCGLPEELQLKIKAVRDIECSINQCWTFQGRLPCAVPGLACIAPQENKFCRAVVDAIDVTTVGCVAVAFVDYGSRAVVPSNKVLLPREEWLECPALAVRMKLDGLSMHSRKNQNWPPILDTLESETTDFDIVERHNDVLTVRLKTTKQESIDTEDHNVGISVSSDQGKVPVLLQSRMRRGGHKGGKVARKK